MADEILCPSCYKLNGIQKFCIYCGHKLLDDDQIRLIKDNSEPYCLNCGRPVKRGQTICECGYEFRNVKCPKCTTENEYVNRFCISCGEKLWTSNVYYYIYPQRLFEHHFINEELPPRLYNTALYKRSKNKIGKNPQSEMRVGIKNEDAKSLESKIHNHLCEIRSRWKVVSPHYCINCLSIIKPDEYSCPKCGSNFSSDKKRVEFLKTDNKYVMHQFDRPELKWTSKGKGYYLNSLAPAIGESQFEYRERLKWEFAENKNILKNIKNIIPDVSTHSERPSAYSQVQRQPQRTVKSKGGYCGLGCRHCYEEFFDSNGGIVGDIDDEGYFEYYCHLGHSVVYGRYCEDYE